MRRLVRFSNGKYGVRAHWFFGWYFFDLISPGFKWMISGRHFSDCQGTKEQAEAIYGSLSYRVIE